MWVVHHQLVHQPTYSQPLVITYERTIPIEVEDDVRPSTAVPSAMKNVTDTIIAATGLCEMGLAQTAMRAHGPTRPAPVHHYQPSQLNQGEMITAGMRRPNARRACIHGRRPNVCRDCGGSSICEHGRRRSVCHDCGGSSLCSHGKQRSLCKACGGGSICKHSFRRSRCHICTSGVHIPFVRTQASHNKLPDGSVIKPTPLVAVAAHVAHNGFREGSVANPPPSARATVLALPSCQRGISQAHMAPLLERSMAKRQKPEGPLLPLHHRLQAPPGAELQGLSFGGQDHQPVPPARPQPPSHPAGACPANNATFPVKCYRILPCN